MALVGLDGRWLRVNHSLCELVGRSEKELLGLTFQDITHPDDLAMDLAEVRRLLAGEIRSYTIEKRYVHKSGRALWILLTASVVPDAHGAPLHFIALIQDIDERKRTEAALRDSEERHRVMAETASDAILTIDLESTILFANPAVERIFGYPPQELVGRKLTVLMPEYLRHVHEAGLRRYNATGVRHIDWTSVELPGLHRDGHEVPLELSFGETYLQGRRHFIGIVRDVTERARTAAARRESEARFRSLVDHNLDAVISVDLEGRIVSHNAACEALTGYTSAELLGQPFGLFVPAEHLPLAQEHFVRATEGTPQTYEITLLHKSGRRVEVMANNVPIVVEGRVVGVFEVVRDVTEQRSLQDQLRQAHKMEAVGRLAGGIAHDFNNLLTAILSNAELVLSELAEGSVRQDVELIRQTAERAAALTRQLLAFSRKQIVQPRLVDLNAVVRELDPLLRRSVGDGIRLETDLGEIARVLADPGQLEQVLVNLAMNARDAMPDGGALTIRTREMVVDETFTRRHRGLRPGSYVALTVEDTGLGMDQQTQSRVFEPFFTTKPIGKGTGLGLATVYGIVKQGSGYVSVESTPGHGSTFTIYLPRQEGAADPPQKRIESLLPGGNETILVVEDEAAVRVSIRRILTLHGYTVLEARHGADALQILQATERPIDLVMTDLVMPEMSGRELIAELQGRCAGPTILVMSGYDEQLAMRGESLPPGTAFLEKPFTLEGLLQTVRTALNTAVRG